MSENETGLMQRNEEGDIRTMVAAVKNRLAAVRELMKSELKGPTKEHPEGRDYGVIPGTKKNVLFLPGAEKIALMFQFAPSFELTHTDLPGGHRECNATCTLTNSATGRIVGQCSGSASTMEAKHRYRGASGKACPACGAMSCKSSKKEWGGGYYCDQKAGGCGERFKPGSDECKALDELPTSKQENPDPADQWNTVVKIAQKRAYVGAVKTASAASEIFTVDMEDAAKSDNDELARPPVGMPAETTGKAPPSSGAPSSKISEPQQKRLFAIAHNTNVTQEDLRLHLKGLGIEHTKDIPRSIYDQICAWAEAGGQELPADESGLGDAHEG
jgi:hypothetical protein